MSSEKIGYKDKPYLHGCRYPTDRVSQHTSFKLRQGAGRAPMRCHMPCGTRPYLLGKVRSGAAKCLVAPDPTFLIGRVLLRHMSYSYESFLPAREGSGSPRVLQPRILPPCKEGSGAPCVLQLQILPPCRAGLQSTTCPTALNPASLPGWLQCHHRMPCSFLWTTTLKHKEKPSRPACVAWLACSQCMHTCFQGT
jgi:hypothetical protein